MAVSGLSGYLANVPSVQYATSSSTTTYTMSSKRCEICEDTDHDTGEHVELCVHCGAECFEDNYECDECLGLDNDSGNGGFEDTPFSPPS